MNYFITDVPNSVPWFDAGEVPLFCMSVFFECLTCCLFWQFDISDLVRTMRLQRHGMVQTEVGLHSPGTR